MIQKREYVFTDLQVVNRSPEELLSNAFNEDIKERMIKVINTEGPIREQLLFKRVINSYSLEKVGSRLLELFNTVASTLSFEKSIENDEIVYHNGCEENFFRPTPDSTIRYSYQIPYTEAACCILYILARENKSLLKKQISQTFLQEMEWQRQGAKVKDLIDGALKDPRIKNLRNGRYTINS